LHRITGVVILIYTILYLAGTSNDCFKKEGEKGESILEELNISMFLLLAIGFFVTGLVMCLSLKKHFPAFYTKFGWILKLATTSLCAPLLIRAVDSWLLDTNDSYYCYSNKHEASFNVVFAILSTIAPAVA